MGMRILVGWMLLMASGFAVSAELSPRQILQKVAQPREGLQDYVCTVALSANSPKVHIEKVTATLYFKHPHKYHFESKEGVGFFPKQAFSADWVSEELMKKVDLKIVETTLQRGAKVHRIRLTPLEKPQQGHSDSRVRVDLLVDGDRFLLKGVEASSPAGGTPSMQITHQKVAGRFWLPKKTVLKTPVPGTSEPAAFTLTFSRYRTNVGLSDEVFATKPSK